MTAATTVRDRSGVFARSFRLEWTSGLLSPVEVLRDGSILAVAGRSMAELEGTGRIRDEALVSRHAPDGVLIDSLLRLPPMSAWCAARATAS